MHCSIAVSVLHPSDWLVHLIRGRGGVNVSTTQRIFYVLFFTALTVGNTSVDFRGDN